MTGTLRGMQKKRAAGESGFTLVELLVVVVIIGVLVAIAVPMYLNYRKGAANKSAESDVRAAVSAVEQFYTENGNVYPFNTTADIPAPKLVFGLTSSSATGAGGTVQTATLSPDNIMQYKKTAAGDTYKICGMNKDGKNIYIYNSAAGGSVQRAATSVTSLANCVL
jgi:type IV pilus assembly protein PilA